LRKDQIRALLRQARTGRCPNWKRHAVWESSSRNRQVVFLPALVVAVFGTYRFIRWIFSGPVGPDPWDETVTAEIGRDDATPLCCHCLAPHDSETGFCRECGAPVGAYTNWLPFPYLFSTGYLLRAGTNGNFLRSPLTITGFFLLGFAEYALLAPVYWAVFLNTLLRRHRSDPSSAIRPPPPGDDDGPAVGFHPPPSGGQE
jgi:hypothetical protein